MASLGALLLYVAAATPFVPALTALAACLDPAHHAIVAMSADGPRVVLHHDGAHLPTHHHGPIAKVLTFFAQPGVNGQPDHVLQFRAAGASERTASVAVTTSGAVKQTLPAPALAAFVFHAALPDFSFNSAPPAPPEASARLLAVRTTVLLI